MQLKNIGTSLADAQTQEDAWLNDVGPSAQSVDIPEEVLPSRQGMHESVEQTLSSTQPTGYIGLGHPLWPVLLRLSECIWQELYQKPDVVPISEPVMVEFVRKRAFDLLRAEPLLANQVRDRAEAELLLQSIVEEVLGYGPFESLLKDDSISEIMAIGPRLTYIERNGKVQEAPCDFEDERHMLRIIDTVLRRAGRGIEPHWPMADVRLPDGSLVNIVVPPGAISGPTITIRKSSKKPLDIAGLVELGSMTQEMADFLGACVQARLNIVICGGVGSGRTTLLNALSSYIAPEERLVTIEDIAELELGRRHVVKLVSPLVGPHGSGRVTMRDMLISALHMRPERIIVGECKGDEVVEMLSAMYTGYDGSLMTVYANNPRDCLTRLEMLCLVGGMNAPVSMIRAQIASTLDVIVHLGCLRDESRKIISIVEVQGVSNDLIKLQSIFHYRDAEMDREKDKGKGTFEPGGFCPTFMPKFEKIGIRLPREMFVPRRVI